MTLLKPALVIPVGKLAIAQFMAYRNMEAHVGQQSRCTYADHAFDAIPLPHPSGVSPWPRVEPGKTLLRTAMQLIAAHPAMASSDGECLRNGRPPKLSWPLALHIRS